MPSLLMKVNNLLGGRKGALRIILFSSYLYTSMFEGLSTWDFYLFILFKNGSMCGLNILILIILWSSSLVTCRLHHHRVFLGAPLF